MGKDLISSSKKPEQVGTVIIPIFYPGNLSSEKLTDFPKDTEPATCHL